MTSRPTHRNITRRDIDILNALDRCPLTAEQLLTLSKTFSRPLPVTARLWSAHRRGSLREKRWCASNAEPCYSHRVLFAISATADNQRGPRYTEQALAAIHQANIERRPLTLLFGQHRDSVGLYCEADAALGRIVGTQLAAAYPDCTITELPEESFDAPPATTHWSAELTLSPDIFPIRRYPQFEDALNGNTSDPLAGILASLSAKNAESLLPLIEIRIRPAGFWRAWHAQRAIERLTAPLFRAHRLMARLYACGVCSRFVLVRMLAVFCGAFARKQRFASTSDELSMSATRQHEREEDLQAASDKLGGPLFEVCLSVRVGANPKHEAEARAKLYEIGRAHV